MVSASEAFVPVTLRAVKIRPDQPLVFDFIVDSGNSRLPQEEIKRETEKLAKYFLATLTIPEKDLWVNLSPYEKDRIVPDEFGLTEMGKDLLAQDYILKQLTTSLMYPEQGLGKEFWDRVYAKAREVLGTTEIPTNTFNKVWIVPDKAVVYEVNNTAIVGESHLKVMMEEDYIALEKNANNPSLGTDQLSQSELGESSKATAQAVREIILPEIEKEVNRGKNFALLRQVYDALILATWYKTNLQDSLLSQVYADKKKINGVDSADRNAREEIYQQYIAAYKTGVFNFIKEDVDPQTQELTPRKYFSGGANFAMMREKVKADRQPVASPQEIPAPYLQSQAPEVGILLSATLAVAPATRIEPPKSDRAQTVAFHPVDISLPVDSLTTQSLPNLAYEIAEHLGKALKTQGKDKDILDGVSYRKVGNSVTIFFEDNTTFNFHYDPVHKQVVLKTDAPSAGDAGKIFTDMLTANTRFANTGYSRPVPITVIQDAVNIALEMPLTNYDADIEQAWSALGVPVHEQLKVMVTDTGDQESFGIAVWQGAVVIEKAFLNRIEKLGNKYGMLTRAIIFAITPGDWADKKVAEYQWARKNFPQLGQRTEFQNIDELERFLKQEVNENLLNDRTLNYENRARMSALISEIKRRIARAIGTIGVYEMNEEISNASSIFFPLAADPFHWGQMDTMFRLIMTARTVGGVFRLQGPDFRKILTMFTAEHRVDMMDSLVTNPIMSRYFSMPHDYIGTVDGETAIIDYLIEKADDMTLLRVLYLVGTDHMHFDVPSKKDKDANGFPMSAKLADGSNQPDTIRKLLTLLREKIEKQRDALKKETSLSTADQEKLRRLEKVLKRLDEGTLLVIPAFNERSPLDSIPVSGEQTAVQEAVNSGKILWVMGSNIPAASSTVIRRALAGIQGYEWAKAFLFKSTLSQIMENDVYRGWATQLPDTIRNIAKGSTDPMDIVLLRNWLALARQHKPDLSVQDISAMFTLPEEQVQKGLAEKRKDPNFPFKEELARLSVSDVRAALTVADSAQRYDQQIQKIVQEDRGQSYGGIDFDPALLNLKVERTGDRIQVSVDPAELQRIQTEGVDGFRPVIINIVPIKAMLPALGFTEVPDKPELAGVPS